MSEPEYINVRMTKHEFCCVIAGADSFADELSEDLGAELKRVCVVVRKRLNSDLVANQPSGLSATIDRCINQTKVGEP